ncbi:putative Kunitz/Bovine pancreatic trypsin inhibitor domain protein [Trichinella nativa]|uniref:Putative Kunitz/Bovine pancreatic trypsin inhibitor domain protein n=1 Tax=Trichinella nativa TaxID=6335 RepID=A0A1Y3EYW2_9BILA|nr:putative Kunitz/Bovine pancreatic trypsin inhibitor domain protein [Trichinella nativa]
MTNGNFEFEEIVMPVLTEPNLQQKKCDPSTFQTVAVKSQQSMYMFCNRNREIEIGDCGENFIFNEQTGNCEAGSVHSRIKRQIYAIVGVPCNENIDCQTTDGGTYCDTTKRCACLPSFVNINGFCYKKINPGQSGCTYEEQCNSVWPGAYCSSDSICKCPDGQPPQRTRDGTVCTFPGSCPTNGIYSKLKGVDGYETPCSDGSDDYCPPTYDCLCNPPSLSSGSACTRSTFCCPSRALACIMPRDEGVFTGITVDRWYYNSMTSSCDLFSYRGGGGNANNFETKSQCESYCKTGCPRGQPLYSPGNIADRVPKDSRVTCSVSRTCAHDSNFYCHANQAVGGSVENYCCPRPSFICSQEGGLPTGSTTYVIPPTSFDPGLAGAGVTPKQRYYYDSDKRQCLPFTYNGQAGNFNNFDSESECKQFCSKTICPAGEPLRDNGNSLITCGVGGSGICPVRYECTNDGYCCPSREFVCNQEQAVGACANYAERWYFNSKSRSCERFFYSGCQGNFNNFNSYEQCLSYCGQAFQLSPNVHKGLLLWKVLVHMQSAEAVLILTPARQTIFVTMMVGGLDAARQGRKHAALIRSTLELFALALQFHVGIIIQEVKNVKRFGIMAVTETPTILPPELIVKITVMLEAVRKAANLSKNLEQVNLGFVMVILSAAQLVTLALEHQSNRLACVTITAVLLEASSIKKLQTMKVYFVVLLATICSLGRDPGAHCDAYMDAMTNSPRQCQPNIDNSCPPGFFCSYSTTMMNSFCCGSAISGDPYMEPFLNTPRQCTPGISNTCPANYVCQSTLFNVGGLQSATGFCCGTPNVCPMNYAPFIQNNQPVTCVPNVFPSVCPAALNPCPTGKQPYRYEGAPVVCTQGSVTAGCPPGYSCDLHAETNSFYCCAFGGAQPVPVLPGEGCPSGYITIQPHRYCSPTVPGSCPANAVCSYHRNLNRYMCCMLSGMAPYPTPELVQNPCTAPRQPYMNPVTYKPQVCLLGGTTTGCPAGYSCEYNKMLRNYYCCSKITPFPGSICKPGYVPYIDAATRQPLICPLNVPGFRCPEGYQCTYSDVNHQYYCCRRAGVVRPNGGQESQDCPRGRPYLYQRTKTPLSCVPWGSKCPSGYSCVQSRSRRNFLCCSNTFRLKPLPVSTSSDTPMLVGSACQTNDDCRPSPGENALCHDGLCACSASEMNLNGLCVTDKCPSPYQHVNGECVPVLSS